MFSDYNEINSKSIVEGNLRNTQIFGKHILLNIYNIYKILKTHFKITHGWKEKSQWELRKYF